MTVGSRSSPGSAVGSIAGTGTDEFREGFFVGDDLDPRSAESFVDLRTRFFFRDGAEISTSEDTPEGPISPDRPECVRVFVINEFGCSIGGERCLVVGSREGAKFAPLW
jgi:hypothetical protein